MAGLPGLPTDRIIVGNPLLLVIDMQHDFIDVSSPATNLRAESAIGPASAVLARFRELGLPVVHTREIHRPGRIDAGLEGDAYYHVPEHTVAGTLGAEIIDQLVPLESELVVDKRRYSCFLGTELDWILRQHFIETLVICGVSSDICVHWTAGDAFQRDYHVRVVEDATAGMSTEDHEASLLLIRNLCTGGSPVYSSDVLAALGEHASTRAYRK